MLLAVHHPPVSSDAAHGGATGLAADIDHCAQQPGFWPHAVLSGHAHLYQRFTRLTPAGGEQIPYVVAGAGGYAASKPLAKIAVGTRNGDYTLVAGPIVHFGYLTLTVDVAVHTLGIDYTRSDTKAIADSVTVDLVARTLA